MDSLVSIFLLTCLLSLTNAQTPGPVQNLAVDGNTQQWGFTATWDPPATGNTPEVYNVTITNTNNNEVYERSLPPSTAGSYEIDHLYDGTIYTFSVVAVNSDGEGGQAEEITVTIPGCQLCLDTRGPNYLAVQFPVLGFLTVLNSRSVDSPSQHNGRERSISATSTSTFVLGLSSGVLYELQMENANTGELVYTSRYRTTPDPVTNLQLNPESSSSVEVTFEQPVLDQFDMFDGYRILVASYQGGNQRIDQSQIVGSSETAVIVDGLQAGVLYTISVETFSGELADLTYSERVADNVTLVDLFLVANATTSLTVAWDLPTITRLGFQILYGIDGTSDVTTLPFGMSDTTAMLNDLQPGQNYRIILNVVTETQGTYLLAGAVFQTIPGVVSGIMGVTTDTSIALSWNPPPGIADSYLIMYDPPYGSTPTPSETSDREFTIEGLDPGIAYEVSIITIARDGRSSAASENFMTDLGDTSLIRLKEITATSISVTWSPSVGVTQYSISISPDGGTPTFNVFPGQRLFAEFTGLAEGTQYTVTLVTVPARTPLTAQFQTNPSIPGTISQSNVLPRSATLAWGPSSGADIYEITLSSDGSIVYTMRTNQLSVDVTGLLPATEYTVTVVAEAVQQGITSQSGEQTAVFETLQAVVSLDSVTTNSVRVLGTADTQTILYTPGDGTFILGSSATNGATTLGGLTPGQEYTVTIRVGSNAVDQVSFFTLPAVAQDVTLSPGDPDTSSVLVEYSFPSTGLYDGYRITYSGASVGADGNEPSPIVVDSSSTSTTITGLTPGVVYTVSVLTFVNDESTFSNPTSQTITTASGADASFYVFSKTTDSIAIKFALIGTSYSATAIERNGSSSADGVRSNGQFTFNGLTPGKVYDVTLTVQRAGQSSASTLQMVQTLPNTPTSVAAVPSATSPSITVTWQPVDGGVSHYRIHLVPSAGGEETSIIIYTGLETSYTFVDIQPMTLYDVTVTALARERELEEESYPETVQVTTNPIQLTITSLTTTSLTVSFEAVTGAFVYEIFDGLNNGQQFPAAPATLRNYQPGSLVQLSVYAAIPTGNILVGSQDVLLKPEPVTDFTLTRTSDTLRVSNIVRGNGRVDIIAIEYSSGGTLEGTAYILPSSEKTIEFVQPATTYTVRVFTEVYAGGLSQRSEETVRTSTTLSVDRGVPVVDEITTSTITISWTEQLPYTHRIFIQEKDSDDILAEMSYIQADSTTSHTFDVQPATLYQVTIELIASVGSIFRTSSKDVRSLPEAPTFSQITSVDLTSITLLWDIPADATSDGFEVRVLPPPVPGNYPILVNERSYIIRSLRPGTVYDISVVSLSGQADNCQTFSSPVQIVTSTEPLGVFEIVAVDIFDTRASVKFTPYDVMFFDVGRYEVTVMPSDGGTPQVISVRADACTADIMDLMGGTRYDVELSAIMNSNGQSFNTTAATTFVTLPKAPLSVTPISRGFFSFTVELEPPVNSSYDGFVITANGDSQQILRGEPYQATFENLIPGLTYSVDAYSFLFTPDLTSQALMDFTPVSVTTDTPDPGEVTVQSFTTDSITISWGDVPNVAQYSVTISPMEGQRAENIMNRRVDFTQLTPGRLYLITLNSERIAGSDITTSVMQRTNPSPPSSLIITTPAAADTIGLQLSWSLPTEGDWDRIRITYTPTNGISQSELVGRAVTTFTLEGLFQNTDYTVDVTSVSGLDNTTEESAPASQTVPTRRLPAGSMIITLIDETTVSAIWTIWDNGVILYELLNQDGITDSTETLPNARLTLSDLTPASVYRLTVEDLSGQNNPIAREFRTGPSPVSGIEVIEDRSNAFEIAFTWTPSPDAEFYRPVLVHPDGREESHPGGDIHATSTLVATFSGLEPDSRYELIVRSGLRPFLSFNQETLGRAVTAEYTTDTIANGTITETGKTSTTITLAITPPNQRVTLLYIVYYLADNTRVGTAHQNYLSGPPPVTEIILENLTPATTYRFRVSWLDGANTQIAPDYFTSTLSSSPTGFTVSAGVISNSVTLNWIPPVPSDNLVGYKVIYSPSGDGGEAELYAGPTDRSGVIENLVPGIPYTFSLSSLVRSQGGDAILESEPVAFQYILVSTAGQPYVLYKTNSSIKYIWTQFAQSGHSALTLSLDGVQVGNRIEVPGSDQPSYLIEGLESGAEYELTVDHYTLFQTSSSTGTPVGTYSVLSTTNPNRPGAITVLSVEQTSAVLGLAEPLLATNYTGYEISFRRNGSNIEVLAGAASADDEMFTVEGLNPDTLYIFYVRTVSGIGPSRGVSEPSVVEDSTSTLQPGQIIVQTVDTTMITFAYGRDNNTVGGVTYVATRSPTDGSILHDPEERRVFLTGLVPGKSYTLTLNVMGNTDSVYTKSTRTVPLQPTTITAVPNFVDVVVSWSAPLGSILNGYEVSLNGAVYKDVPADTTRLVIGGLVPSTGYQVTVRSISEDLNARRTSSPRTQSFTTLTPVCATAATCTIYVSVTSTTADAYFGALSGDGSFYISTLFYESTAIRPDEVLNSNSVSFDGLNPSTVYTVEISTLTSLPFEETFRTNPPSPGPITIQDITPTSVTVSWERAADDISTVDGYVLSYVDSAGIETETVFSNPCDPNEYTLTGLSPDSYYRIIVRTQLREIAGMFSEQEGDVSSSVPFDTEPVPDDVIVVQRRSTTTLVIVWNAVSLSNQMISYKRYDTEDPDMLLSVTGDTATLGGLQPGTLYSFELIIRDNTVASGTGRTVPRQPGTLAATVTSTELNISWQPQAGNVDFYRITVAPLDMVECPQMVERITNADEQAVVFNRLFPDTRYLVTVKAVAGINQDQIESTAQTNFFTTAPAQAGEVFVRNVTSYFMEILFETIDTPPFTSPHVLIITPATNAGVDIIPIQGDTRIVEITDLTPGETYRLYVERNSVSGPDRQITTIPLPPENVRVLSDRTTQTSLTVAWDLPSLTTTSPAPVVDQYIVEIFQDSNPTAIQAIGADATEATVSGLEVSTEYDIHVTSLAGLNVDDVRSDTIIRTASTVTPLPGEILVISYTTTTIDFVYGDSSTQPGFTSYDVTYSPITLTSILTSTGPRRGRLSGLTPGALYSINLAVDQTVPQEDTATQRTVPLPPTGLTVITQTPLSVTFIWSLGDSELDNYTISYSIRGDDFEVTVSPGLTTYELTNLEPNTVWDFTMVTVSGNEQSTEATVSGSTDPLDSNVILAAEVTATSIKAWFAPISGATGPYGVARAGEDDLSIQENAPLTFTLTGLSPSTQYEIEIYRMNQQYSDSVRTNPPNPGNVNSIVTGRFTARLSFDAGVPPEAVNSYEIYRQDDGSSRVLGNPSFGVRVLIATLPATGPLSYEDTGLNPNTIYVYEICSLLNAADGFPAQRSNQVQIVDVLTDELPVRTADVRDTNTTDINLVWLTTDIESTAFFISYKAPQDVQFLSRTLTVDAAVLYAEYILSSLTPGELYTIRVQSGDGVLNDEFTQRTRPNPIATFATSPVTSTTITVNWVDAPGVLSYYEVVYDPPNGQSPRRTDVRTEETNTVTLSGLFPDFDYTVTVVTWSGTGEDATSSFPVSQMFRTATIQQLEVIVRFVNETQVQLTWGLIPGENNYLVSVEDSGLNSFPSDATVPEGETPLSVIDGLTPGTLYTARVRTQTVEGMEQQFRTPPFRPSSLTVTGQTPTSISVAWTAPPDGGIFDEYILSYSIGDRIRTEVGRFARDVTTATISNLNTATTYNIYLVAEANDGGFPESSDVNTVDGTTEIPAPGEIVIINQTPTSFRFQWGPAPEQGVTYITTYSPIDGSKVDNLNVRQSDVTGATPGRLYELTVFILPRNQQGRGFVRTLPSSPGLLATTNVDYVSVTLAWIPGTGEYSGFIVSYKPSVESAYIDLQQVGADVTSAQVTDLSPGVAYDFSVVAVSGENYTTYSYPTRRTNVTTLLIQTDNFVVLDFNSTAISVAWRDVDTPIIVDINPVDDERRNVNVGDRPVHTFTGLNPSTVYTISRLNQFQTFVRTNPASPRNLVTSVTPTSFLLEWTAADSEVSQYKVEVRCADSDNPCSFSSVVYPNERLAYEVRQLFPLREYLVSVSSCLDADGQFDEQTGDEPVETTIITNRVPDDEIIVQETGTNNITILYSTAGLRGFVEAIYIAGTQPPEGTLVFDSGPTVRRTFDGLTAGRLYTIQIRDLTNTYMQTINVRTRPSPPVFVAGNPTSTSLSIIWGASAGDVSFYEVRYSPPDGTTPAVSTVDATGPLTLNIANLLPQKIYTVFVRAVTGLDNTASISEALQGSFETTAAQQGEVILRRITTTSIAYTFGEIPGTTQYVVQLSLGTSTNIEQGNVHTPQDIVGEFDSLTPGQLYTLYLRVDNVERGSIQVRTRPSPPRFFIIQNPSVTFFDVIWTTPEGTYQNFLLVITNPDGTRRPEIALGPNDFSQEVTDLLPGTRYIVELYTTVGTQDNLIRSEPAAIEGMTVSLGPLQVIYIDRTTDSLEVAWGANIRPNPGVYRVFFHPDGQLDATPLVTQNRDIRGTSLVAGQLYNVKVQSENYPQDTGMLDVRTIPFPVRDLALDGVATSVSFRVSWSEPSSGIYMYDGYAVYIAGQDNVQRLVSRIDDVDMTQVLIEDLDPNQEYSVSVYAIAGFGQSTEVRSEVVQATVSTVSLDPLVLETYSVTETTIGIAFGPAVDEDLVTSSGYTLSLTSDGTTVQLINIPVGGSTKYVFMGLTPGALYRAQVQVRDTSLTSDPLEIRTMNVSTTEPEPTSATEPEPTSATEPGPHSTDRTASSTASPTQESTNPPPNPNTFLYVGIAAAVVIILLIALMVYIIKLRIKLSAASQLSTNTPTHPPLPPEPEIHLNHAYDEITDGPTYMEIEERQYEKTIVKT